MRGPPAYHGEQHGQLSQVSIRDGERVVREDGEVGAIAYGQSAGVLLFAGGPRRADGEALERLQGAQGLADPVRGLFHARDLPQSAAGALGLDEPGQRVGVVPPNPLLGISYDSAFIRDFLHTISGPIILVGHSYGGAVITNAATGDNQVKALVYVDAFAPAQGQTIGQLVAAHPGSCVLPPANVTAQPYPGAPAGAVDVYIKQDVFPSCMANGLPASEAGMLAATGSHLSAAQRRDRAEPGRPRAAPLRTPAAARCRTSSAAQIGLRGGVSAAHAAAGSG